MERKWKIAIVVVTILSILIAGVIFAITQGWIKIPGDGQVKKIGVEVYWDEGLTEVVDSIQWGLIGPNETIPKEVYIQNLGNINASLSLLVDNWNPTNASDYLSVSWNGTGVVLGPLEAQPITFELSANENLSADIFSSFTFDMTITGTEI